MLRDEAVFEYPHQQRLPGNDNNRAESSGVTSLHSRMSQNCVFIVPTKSAHGADQHQSVVCHAVQFVSPVFMPFMVHV